MMIVTEDSTDVTTYFHLRLAADGTDATGLTITNIDLQYTRSGATPAAKVDATALGAANSAHGDNQAFEIDSTDQPGVYRVDWPDAAFATGVREVILTVKCATAFTESLRCQIVSATRGLAGTALPNAAAEASGGLYTRGTGAGQINQAANGQIDSNAVAISGDSTAADRLEQALDDTAGSVPWFGIVDQGTAQSVTGTTIVLRSAAAFADDELNGAVVHIVSATTGAGQSRTITDYVQSTDTATVDTWTTTPTGTIVYKVFAVPPGPTTPIAVDVVKISGDTTAADNLELYLDGTEFMPVNAYAPDFSISGGTLTTKKPDGSTNDTVKTLTTDAAAVPIIAAT